VTPVFVAASPSPSTYHFIQAERRVGTCAEVP
jgi:hypothetical protein